MSKTISRRIFGGIAYDLPFDPTVPLHIPAGWLQPPAGYEIAWDFDSAPHFYYRDKVDTESFDAQVILDPRTGVESVHVDFRLEEATTSQARIALGQLIAWFTVAVESHLPAGEGK
ncbi:hypothetical protein [Rothia terrae]|uniref:hypothetical protein n=1 Tax=Rothia terrae TaxID=396015 RepID=UPI0033F23169